MSFTPESGTPDSLEAAGQSGSALKRVIGVGGLGFASLNCIVGSGIFGIPALAAMILGPSAILAYLVCVVLVGLVGLCFAEIGSRVATPGGLYAYARVPFGPVVGGMAGTLLWFANCAVPNAAVAVYLVDTAALVWPALQEQAMRVGALAAIYTLLTALNIRGTQGGARVSMVIALIKIAPLILLAVAGWWWIDPHNLRWVIVPPASDVGKGAVLLFFGFMGIEGGLSASGEVVNPSRTVPRAIALALTLVAFLYIGLQTVAQGVLGSSLATTHEPLIALATAMFGAWGTRLLIATTLLSVSGYLIADMLCSPRVLYALAEEGQLPGMLARVNSRFGTPARSIIAYAVLCFAIAASGSFRQLVVIGSSGTLVLYLIACVGLLRLRAKNIALHGVPFRAPGGWLVPIAASVIITWMLTTLSVTDLAACGGLLAVSAAVYSVREWQWKSG